MKDARELAQAICEQEESFLCRPDENRGQQADGEEHFERFDAADCAKAITADIRQLKEPENV